jgi:hypothetical protein
MQTQPGVGNQEMRDPANYVAGSTNQQLSANDARQQNQQFSANDFTQHSQSKEAIKRGNGKGESNSMRNIFSLFDTMESNLQFDTGSPMSQSYIGTSTSTASTYSNGETADDSTFVGVMEQDVTVPIPIPSYELEERSRKNFKSAENHQVMKDNFHFRENDFSSQLLQSNSSDLFESLEIEEDQTVEWIGTNLRCYTSEQVESSTDPQNDGQIDTAQPANNLSGCASTSEKVPWTSDSKKNESAEKHAPTTLDVILPPPGNVSRLAATFQNLLPIDASHQMETVSQPLGRVSERTVTLRRLEDRSATQLSESGGTIHRYAFPTPKSYPPIGSQKNTATSITQGGMA